MLTQEQLARIEAMRKEFGEMAANALRSTLEAEAILADDPMNFGATLVHAFGGAYRSSS